MKVYWLWVKENTYKEEKSGKRVEKEENEQGMGEMEDYWLRRVKSDVGL